MNEVRFYAPGDLHEGFHRPGDEVSTMHSVLLEHGSFVRTLTVGEEVAAVMGMRVRWPGVADVWAVVGEPARGHGVWLTRTTRTLLDQFASELALWRIGALVKASMPENARWAKVLGFEFEGTERMAAPDGGDLLRYVKWTSSEVVGQRLQ